MRLRFMLAFVAATLGAAVVLAAAGQQAAPAPRAAAAGVTISPSDVGGVVMGPNGPEAGVWVIAETSDFATKMRKIVVTDDGGRYLVPDLPKANYQVWVRGYGLVDSRPVSAKPGSRLALTAVPAPNARAAAQYYPANYWYSLLRVPEKTAFPLTVPVPAPAARGTPGAMTTRTFQSQDEWINAVKGCIVCHQMGDKGTRELPPGLGVS